jgi:hypothetical protein
MRCQQPVSLDADEYALSLLGDCLCLNLSLWTTSHLLDLIQLQGNGSEELEWGSNRRRRLTNKVWMMMTVVGKGLLVRTRNDGKGSLRGVPSGHFFLRRTLRSSLARPRGCRLAGRLLVSESVSESVSANDELFASCDMMGPGKGSEELEWGSNQTEGGSP